MNDPYGKPSDNPSASVPATEDTPSVGKRNARTWGIALLVVYFAAAVAIGLLWRPLGPGPLAGVALAPAVVAFVLGLPRVARSRPRGLMAVFHLIVYPLGAAVTIGLPGALVAYLAGSAVPG